MRNTTLLGPWIRRFLLEHLVAERNLAHNTQASYRDAMVLLLPFLARSLKTPIDRLSVEDLSPPLIRRFLAHLEKDRATTRCCCSSTIPALGWTKPPMLRSGISPGALPMRFVCWAKAVKRDIARCGLKPLRYSRPWYAVAPRTKACS